MIEFRDPLTPLIALGLSVAAQAKKGQEYVYNAKK